MHNLELRRHFLIEFLERRDALSVAPAPQLLSAADFHYQGAIALPGGFESLTYRPSTNTFFAISHDGHDPYDLVELSFACGAASVVKDWGPLDVNGEVSIQGSLLAVDALLYVNNNELLVNPAQYYVSQVNNPALWSFSLTSGHPVLDGGPWYVPASVGAVSLGSNAVRGNLTLAPSQISTLGYGLEMGSVVNGASGEGSWGLSYVGVQMPTPPFQNTPAGSTLKAAQFIDWPASDTPAMPFTHSSFPPALAGTTEIIKGNDDVGAVRTGLAAAGSANTLTLASDGTFTTQPAPENSPVGWCATVNGQELLVSAWNPTTRLATVTSHWAKAPMAGIPYSLYLATYQRNRVYVTTNLTTPLDDVGSGTSVELLNSKGQVAIDGMFYVGQVALGAQWYGNAGSHDDETALGLAGNNDLTTPDINANRGWHAESRGLRWYIADPAAIAATADKVLWGGGAATTADLEVPYVRAGNLATLGGTVRFPEPHNLSATGQVFFKRSADGQSGTLYVLLPNSGPNGTSVVEVFAIYQPGNVPMPAPLASS
ncbi:MAG TPA: hypothetical protein VGX76_05605, partial [Pirellulales bacterium]|nr:hypothetical protein [Pirellulales bacterium]